MRQLRLSTRRTRRVDLVRWPGLIPGWGSRAIAKVIIASQENYTCTPQPHSMSGKEVGRMGQSAWLRLVRNRSGYNHRGKDLERPEPAAALREGHNKPPRLAGSFGLKSRAEKVRDLVTGLLRVVNGYLAGFVRSFRNVFARIFRGVVG